MNQFILCCYSIIAKVDKLLLLESQGDFNESQLFNVLEKSIYKVENFIMKFIVNLLMIKLRMIIFGNKKGKMNKKKKKKNSGVG